VESLRVLGDVPEAKTPDVKRRLKLYTSLHRFPPLDISDRLISEGASLDAILDAQ
jgi:hypothetical protein